MKTNMTKILVVLLTLVMVLSLAACGEKNPPAESTPAQTTPEATPEASTPEASTPDASTPEASTPNASTPEASTPEASTPEASTPEDTETGKESGKDTDPVTPSVTRPTETTMESYTTDGDAANWVFEINKVNTAITVDGIIDEAAYYNGVYLVAEINMPASDSTFSVFFTADETHIYVFYEFIKAEDIFWDANYGSKYHLDCVDFCLNLAGLKAAGKEFHIMAGVEGPKGTAAIGYDPATAGVDNWYVKHTEEGYNVEFSIPLEKVTGTDNNGDKKISFTALSTITTAWEDKTAAPARVYTAAMCAAGALSKDNPSYLVVKGTKVEGQETYEKTEDGRYLITVKAAKESLKGTDIQAYATTNGIVMEGKFCDGPDKHLNDKNNYKAYITADAEYLYVLFDINDSNLVAPGGASYWQNDCAEIDFDVTGGTAVNSNQMRVWPAAEGTNHYKADDAYGAWHNNGGGVSALDKQINAGILESYTVTLKDGGYKVLFTFKRAALKDTNTIAMYFSIALGDVDADNAAGYSRAYVAVDSVAKAAGNSAKPYANVFKIVDAQ